MSRCLIVIAWLPALSAACAVKPDPAPPASRETTAPFAPSPAASLDAMDPRTPVPLLPMMAHHQKQNMRDHLAAVQEITAAVARNDFAAVGTSAKRIGYSEQMGRMCEHMGRGAEGFTELALEFHQRADTIGKAAESKDAGAVLAALGETLTVCTSCHARFKQQIVTEASFGGLGAPAH